MWVVNYASGSLNPVTEMCHHQFPSVGYMRGSLPQTYIHLASNLSCV